MNEFQKYLVEEFAEDYEEGRITRRQALRMIAGITGSLIVASTILAACSPPAEESPGTPGAAGATPEATGQNSPQLSPTAEAESTSEVSATPLPEIDSTAVTQTGDPNTSTQAPYGTVSPDDETIEAGPLEFPAEDGTNLMGYQARPPGVGPFPVVLVCHENRGLTPHIQDVTRRLAKAGYTALAVDLLSRSGGTSALSAEDVPGVLGSTEPDQFVSDFRSGWTYLRGQPYAQADRVGMVGFCFGGGVTWRMATHMPELRAAVPFYGPHPLAAEVPNIQAVVLAIYAERDQRINQGIPAIEEAMQANQKTYEKVIYPNADHAFHNDTGQRYNPEAARDAWSRTLAWFAQYL